MLPKMDGEVLSKLIGLDSLLSYKKLDGAASAHVPCISASPSRESQVASAIVRDNTNYIKFFGNDGRE